MADPKISDCEAVLKKQAAAMRAATAILKTAAPLEDRMVEGKKKKVPVINKDAIKKAEVQFNAARKEAGYHYEFMKKYYEQGKNPVRNDFEKAAAEYLALKKVVDNTPDLDFPKPPKK